MAKKKRRDVKSLITPKLRQMSRYWHEKRTARDAAKVKVEIGTFKNGNIKHHTMYRCNSCEGSFEYTDTHMDHIEPVVDPDTGWVSWDVYIERLFCPADNYQCLCVACHEIKTEFEKQYRADVRKRKKELDNEE